MKICPNCGTVNQDSSKFCYNCGNSLLNQQRYNSSEKNKKNGIRILICGLTLLAVLGIALGILTFLLTRRDKSYSKETIDFAVSSEETGSTEESAGAVERILLNVESFNFVQYAFECGNTPVETLVKAVTDTDEDTSDIKLFAVCKDNGDIIELTDDGKGADTSAGDHVFNGMASFSSDEEKTLNYTLCGDSEAVSVTVAEALVKFYTLESYYAEVELCDQIEEDLDKITAEYEGSQNTETTEDYYLQIREKIETYLDKQVEKDTVVSYDWNESDVLIHFPLSGYIYSFGQREEGVLNGSQEGSSGRGHIGGGRHDDPNSVLLMAPCEDLLPYISDFEETLDDLAYEYAEYQYSTRILEEVDIELLKHLDQYRIITVKSHGNCYKSIGSIFWTGIPNSEVSEEDDTNGRLIKSSSNYAVVTPAFFDDYYKDGSLNESLWYFNSCSLANDKRLSMILKQKGANAVLCYLNPVYSSYGSSMFKSIINELIKPDNENEGLTRTIREAWETAISENGAQDPTEHVDEKTGKVTHASLILDENEEASPFRLVKNPEDNSAANKKEGECGENLHWKIWKKLNLYISGTGEMYDYNINNGLVPPWNRYSKYIYYINISEGVTSIGQDAFSGFDGPFIVDVPASLQRVNAAAFKGCTQLGGIHYQGSEDDWAKIYVDEDNEYFAEARVYFDSNGIDGSVKTDYLEKGSVKIDFTTNQQSFDYSYRMPKLQETDPIIVEINKEIKDNEKETVHNCGGNGYYKGRNGTVDYEDILPFVAVQEDNSGLLTLNIDYEYAEYEDILSVRVMKTICDLRNGSEFPRYTVYSIDRSHGQRLYGFNIPSRLGIHEENVLNRLKYEIMKESKRLCLQLEGYSEDSEDIPEWLQAKIDDEAEASIVLNDFDEIMENGVYLDSSGHLQIYVQMALGASSEYSFLVDIDPTAADPVEETHEGREYDASEALYAVTDEAAASKFIEENGFVQLNSGEGENWGIFDPDNPEYPIISMGQFSLDDRYYISCDGPCEITLCGIKVGDGIENLEEAIYWGWYGSCTDREEYTSNGDKFITIYLAATDGHQYHLQYRLSDNTIMSWYVYIDERTYR